MASERLSDVLGTFVEALAEANATLAEKHQETVTYLITEMDAAIGYGRIELGDRGAVVDLDDRGQEGTGKVIRLKVSPVSLPPKKVPEDPKGPDPRDPKQVVGLVLHEGLRAIALAGLPTDQLVVAFDPTSEKPEGTIVDYAMELDPAGAQRFVFTVAGRPPKGGDLELEGPVPR